MRLKSIQRLCYSTLLMGTIAYADISGTVYKELPISASYSSSTKERTFAKSSYGHKDSNRLGVAGITFQGVDASSTTQTATEGANGSYSRLSGQVRVELSGYEPKYSEGMDGSNKNAAVGFVNDGDTVNLSLHTTEVYFAKATKNMLYCYVNSAFL